MDLLSQFQGVLGSLMLGGLFLFFFQVFQSLLKHKYLMLIWYIFQTIYFFGFAFGYYFFLCEYTFGIYNFFFTLSLILGALLYLIFYQKGVKRILDPVKEKIDKYIVSKEDKIKKIRQERKMKKLEKRKVKANNKKQKKKKDKIC